MRIPRDERTGDEVFLDLRSSPSSTDILDIVGWAELE
jgi:hypothetical protein